MSQNFIDTGRSIVKGLSFNQVKTPVRPPQETWKPVKDDAEVTETGPKIEQIECKLVNENGSVFSAFTP